MPAGVSQMLPFDLRPFPLFPPLLITFLEFGGRSGNGFLHQRLKSACCLKQARLTFEREYIATILEQH